MEMPSAIIRKDRSMEETGTDRSLATAFRKGLASPAMSSSLVRKGSSKSDMTFSASQRRDRLAPYWS